MKILRDRGLVTIFFEKGFVLKSQFKLDSQVTLARKSGDLDEVAALITYKSEL